MSSFPSATWRVLWHTAPMDGATQMATDEALLRAVAAGTAPPTLRFYAWSPPCLSLGHAQPESDVDWTRLQARGWQAVRRPTGGRAILHTDELTYALIAPQSDPRLAGDIVASYRQLSAGLLYALQALGVDAHADKKTTTASALNPVCFEVPSNYEITWQGRKLVGSAQKRAQGVVLQHGSLPLHGDVGRIVDALAFPDEAARETARDRVRARATTLSQAAGRPITWEEAAHAVQAGWAHTLNLNFVAG